jgi:squalene-associated FAD-dependent desaturase
VEDRAPRLKRVAVIGAGWAGCAAAVTLARLGYGVTVLEAASVPGGRARRVVRDGLALDNGQHLMLGAYLQTRNVLAAVHGGNGESLLSRSPLALRGFAGSERPFALHARRLPGSLGLLAGLLLAEGLTFGERVGVIAWFRRLARRGFRCAPDQTVAELLDDGPRVAAERLWNPLCLAALNTPPERASAQVFANVLRASFAGGSGASDFLLPSTDLSSLLPEAALAFVVSHGGQARLGARASLELGDDAVTVRTRDARQSFDAAVVAVGPHQLDDVVGDAAPFAAALSAVASLDYEPIATVWLGYGSRTPMPAAILRLDDAPGQWVVDRSEIVSRAAHDPARCALAQLVAVVISARGSHEAVAARELADLCDAQLRRIEPRWPPLAWSQTIVEKRATYACVPGRAVVPDALPHPRVALAGDYVDAEFPATLEAAVRTGAAAAFAIDASLGRR